jgi:hypothetical protein
VERKAPGVASVPSIPLYQRAVSFSPACAAAVPAFSTTSVPSFGAQANSHFRMLPAKRLVVASPKGDLVSVGFLSRHSRAGLWILPSLPGLVCGKICSRKDWNFDLNRSRYWLRNLPSVKSLRWSSAGRRKCVLAFLPLSPKVINERQQCNYGAIRL